MAKPNAKFARILKQILTLAVPLILKAIKNRKASSGGGSGGGSGGAKNTSGGADAKPIAEKPKRKAKKRSDRKSSQRASREPASGGEPPRRAAPQPKHKPSPIAELYRDGISDAIITDTGVVVHLLPDDNEGSRHQRFLLEVDHTDVTIKIAHNIDLAPRVPVRKGDRITFKGEYEWNDLGGALHWTHHDPKKWREGGWIDHEGKRYE